MTKLSKRVVEMEESVTLAAGARAKALKAEGRDILELTLGQPDFVTPKISSKQQSSPLKTEKRLFTPWLPDCQS
ncbi:Aspartate aminotransferase [Streptococcus sp. DD13]|nr:Aspartate aminotransferase [Streptococcus sp. DD13]